MIEAEETLMFALVRRDPKEDSKEQARRQGKKEAPMRKGKDYSLRCIRRACTRSLLACLWPSLFDVPRSASFQWP